MGIKAPYPPSPYPPKGPYDKPCTRRHPLHCPDLGSLLTQFFEIPLEFRMAVVGSGGIMVAQLDLLG